VWHACAVDLLVVHHSRPDLTLPPAPAPLPHKNTQVPTAGDDDDGADVVAADIVAGNSVVHVIDKVLIPPSVRRHGSSDNDDDKRRRLLDDDDDDHDDHDDDCHRSDLQFVGVLSCSQLSATVCYWLLSTGCRVP
jgi:hypothetical protein